MSEARKLYFRVMLGAGSKNRTPHSLGKCIEWKPRKVTNKIHDAVAEGLLLPTRWGNVLSGNVMDSTKHFVNVIVFFSPLAGEMY